MESGATKFQYRKVLNRENANAIKVCKVVVSVSCAVRVSLQIHGRCSLVLLSVVNFPGFARSRVSLNQMIATHVSAICHETMGG